jgi:hypothetical protein
LNAHADKSQEKNNEAAAPSASQSQGGGEGVFQFIDDRSENASLNKLQDLADNTPQTTQFKFLQNMANQRSETSMLAQLQTNADKKSLPNQVTQLAGDEGLLIDKSDNANEAVQLASEKNIDTYKPNLSLQKPGETNTTQLAKGAGGSSEGGSPQGNSTGMPDNLKSGIESLSGMSMDHVRVHRNSDKPAQLNAHAYAQGSDIHVGPGQEKHLPHEAWHVVQQAQGRVQPTRQMKGKVNINDDTGLEKEADVMGAKALKAGSTIQGKFSELVFSPTVEGQSINSGVVVQGLFGLSNPFSGLFGDKKKTNEKDGAATNNTTAGDIAKPEETEDNEEIEDNEEAEEKEKIGEEKDADEPTSPVVNESGKTYKYRTQYWVTEPETLRATDRVQAQTTSEKNLSKADAEIMLNKGKTKSAGMLDSVLGVVGLGKQESLLGPKLDPKKNKFYYPAMVDETSKISKKWKPIKIRVPSNPNEKFKSKYASLKKVDGFYPITKMVAMPHDYNAFLDLKLEKKKSEEENKKQASDNSNVASPSNEKANAKTLENKPKVSSALSEDTTEQNLVEEAGKISSATAAPTEVTVEEAPTKENELQEDVEKAEEGKLDLFKKYGKRIFTFATKFSFVRVWINDNLQAGGSAFNELALKAKESAKSVPLLGSLTLVTKPEGTRVTPEGVTFNFGVKFPIGDKEVELSTQLFTDTQSDYSTSYIGSSAKGIAFSIGGDGDGPKFETNLGTITHHFGSESSSYITSSGGSASLSWGAASGSIKWNSLSFSAAQTPKLKGNLSSIGLGLDIFGSKANFEISNPSLADKKLTFTEAKATLDKFEPFSGFEVGPQEVKLIPREKNYDITGETDLKFSNKDTVKEASGKVNLSYIEEKFNLNLTNGSLKAAFIGQTVDIAGVKYDSKTDATKVSADSAVLNLDFNNPIGAGSVKATGSLTNPSVSSAGFGFTSANVVNNEPIDLFNALTFNTIDAKVQSDGSYSGEGDFSATKGEIIQFATGKVLASRAAGEGAKTKYSLSDGAVGVKFGNQNLTVNGIEYNSDIPGLLKAKNAKANFDIPNPTSAERILADGIIRSPKITKDGFDFLVGDFNSKTGVNFFNELKLEKIHLAVFPSGKSIRGQANLNKGEGATAVTNANGLFSINGSYEEGGTINFSLTNGDLGVKFLGQHIDVVGVKYDSQNPTKVSAESAVLNLDIDNPLGAGAVKATGTITNPSVSSEGFGFDSANVKSEETINLFHALNFNNIDATVNSDKSYNGQGDFSVTKGDIIQSATGKVAVSRAAGEGAKTKYSLSDGVVGVKFGNQNLTVNGIEYNSDIPGQVKAKNAKANFDIPNPTSAERILADGTLRSPKITKDGFDFLVGDFNSKTGVNFFNELKLEKIHLAVFPAGKNIQGQANLSKGDAAKAVTNANGLFSLNGSYEEGGAINFSLTNGGLGVKFFDQSIDVTGVKYDSKNPTKVTAESAELKLDLDNPLGEGGVKATGTITQPEVSSTGFGFEKANVVSDAPINLFNALTFNNINATVKSDESYSGEGDLSVTPGDIIKTASGKVSVSRAAGPGAKTNYSLTDGALTVDFGLGVVSLSGVNYNSDQPGVFSMNNANLTTSILGNQVTLGVEGAKVLKEGGFDYEKVGGTLSDLSFGEAAKFSNIEVAYEKATETLTGTTAFNLQGGFDGFTATTTGNVTVTKKGKESSLTLAGASLSLKVGGQKLDLKEMSYAESMLTVGKGTLEFNVFEKKLTAEVTDGTISKDGFNYSSASLALNSSINFGIGNATIGTVTATKTPEGTTISGDGSLSVGGGKVLGISLPELSGKGVISHTFPKDGGAGKTEKELKQVGGKLPDIKLPEALLPPGIWPFSVDLPIPVAPGVSVNIFAGLKGYLSLKDTNITISKGTGEGKYIFNASLNKAKAEFGAAVGAGVMVGNPLVASMMLGIEAAGGVDATFDASFTKEIDTSSGKFELGTSESDYGVEGDIKLSASLVLEGRALYFLKKRKEKLLGEKILGSFEGKKGQKFKFIQAKAPLMSKEDHADEAKEMLPASFKDMTLEELKVVPQDKRFSAEETESAVEGLATAAGSDSNKKMTILGDFLYDRVDFDKLQNALSQLTRVPVNVEEPETTVSENDDPKSFFTKLRESKLVKVVQAQLEHKQIRDQIAESINLKGAMIISYKNAIEEARPVNKADHLELHGIYDRLNDFKRHFHSGLFGDTTKGFASKLGSAVKGVFGAETLEDIGTDLMAEIPRIKTTRNRMNAIQATVDAPSASPRP